jgi:hypothetical protein
MMRAFITPRCQQDVKTPDGVRCAQATMLKWTPDENTTEPHHFQSMWSRQQGSVSVHGFHVSVFPTRPMPDAEFDDLFVQHRDRCTPPGVAEPWTFSADRMQRTRAPGNQCMRLACEALHAFCRAPSTSPEDATLAYYLLHDIGARRYDCTEFAADSCSTRLVYRALCAYDTNSCVIPNAGGYLYDFLPSHLRDDSS